MCGTIFSISTLDGKLIDGEEIILSKTSTKPSGQDRIVTSALQNELNKVLGINLTVDGWYGNNTANAIKGLQGYYGLPQTGTLDIRTFAQLERAFDNNVFIKAMVTVGSNTSASMPNTGGTGIGSKEAFDDKKLQRLAEESGASTVTINQGMGNGEHSLPDEEAKLWADVDDWNSFWKAESYTFKEDVKAWGKTINPLDWSKEGAEYKQDVAMTAVAIVVFHKASVKLTNGGAAGPGNAATAPKLNAQLTFEEASSIFTKSGALKTEIVESSKAIMPASELGNTTVKNALISNGSSISDWAKMTTEMFKSPSGNFQVHYYKNLITNEISSFEMKVKFTK